MACSSPSRADSSRNPGFPAAANGTRLRACFILGLHSLHEKGANPVGKTRALFEATIFMPAVHMSGTCLVRMIGGDSVLTYCVAKAVA